MQSIQLSGSARKKRLIMFGESGSWNDVNDVIKKAVLEDLPTGVTKEGRFPSWDNRKRRSKSKLAKRNGVSKPIGRRRTSTSANCAEPWIVSSDTTVRNGALLLLRARFTACWWRDAMDCRKFPSWSCRRRGEGRERREVFQRVFSLHYSR